MLGKIDSVFAKSLPAYLKAAVGGQQLPVLQFESTENRDRYMSSLYKYFSEVLGPIFLGQEYWDWTGLSATAFVTKWTEVCQQVEQADEAQAMEEFASSDVMTSGSEGDMFAFSGAAELSSH